MPRESFGTFFIVFYFSLQLTAGHGLGHGLAWNRQLEQRYVVPVKRTDTGAGCRRKNLSIRRGIYVSVYSIRLCVISLKVSFLWCFSGSTLFSS